MSDRLTISADTAELFAAIDKIPDAVAAALKENARVTAENIAAEARTRIAHRTFKTRDAIGVAETYKGDGYVVFVGDDRGHIGSFLEFGTKYMTAKPWLFASARLEETAHDERALDAVQDVIDDAGLGSR